MKNRKDYKSWDCRSKERGCVDISIGIVNKLEKFEIQPSLLLNFDQINSKYVYMDKTTIAKKVPYL